MSGDAMKIGVLSFGRFLSGMVMSNIGAFIAWGVDYGIVYTNWSVA
jgi:PTS system mannitol-specific IIC component